MKWQDHQYGSGATLLLGAVKIQYAWPAIRGEGWDCEIKVISRTVLGIPSNKDVKEVRAKLISVARTQAKVTMQQLQEFLDETEPTQ